MIHLEMEVSNLHSNLRKILMHKVLFSKLGVDVKLKEFNLMPHGFLSYNFPIWGMADESMEGIKLGSEWIKELLDLADKNDSRHDNSFHSHRDNNDSRSFVVTPRDKTKSDFPSEEEFKAKD